MAPPVQSAFARTVARTAVAAEISATSPGAATITAARSIAGAFTRTAAEVAATASTAMAAVGAFPTMFAAGLLGAFGRNEDGLGGNAEECGELTFHRGPEANRRLDGDDDWLDLDARTLFTARTITFGARFAARTVALRNSFLAGTITFGPRLARFTARAVTLRDAFLARTITFGAGLARFATRTVTLRDARLARFALFAVLTLLARLRCGLLGEAP